MWGEILFSLKAYVKSFELFVSFRLYKYLFLLLLLLMIFAFPVVIFDFFVSLITGWIPYASAQQYALTGVSLAASISGFFLLLILSPVFSLISEETGKRLTGLTYRFSPTQLIKDILRGLKITLRNLLYQYVIIAVVSIAMHFAPSVYLIRVFGSVLIFLVTAYFYGFSILDYAMENLRMSYKRSVDFVRSHPGIAIGLGSVYYLMISWNDLGIVAGNLGRFAIYWSAFAEALVAFFGVIAASYVMFKYSENDRLGS